MFSTPVQLSAASLRGVAAKLLSVRAGPRERSPEPEAPQGGLRIQVHHLEDN
jgi:hypothetical protein